MSLQPDDDFLPYVSSWERRACFFSCTDRIVKKPNFSSFLWLVEKEWLWVNVFWLAVVFQQGFGQKLVVWKQNGGQESYACLWWEWVFFCLTWSPVIFQTHLPEGRTERMPTAHNLSSWRCFGGSSSESWLVHTVTAPPQLIWIRGRMAAGAENISDVFFFLHHLTKNSPDRR